MHIYITPSPTIMAVPAFLLTGHLDSQCVPSVSKRKGHGYERAAHARPLTQSILLLDFCNR